MIVLILRFIFMVTATFLRKRGCNIHIGSFSWNKMRNLMLECDMLNVQIECLRFKTLSINLWKRTIQVRCTLNGAKINQEQRLRALVDDIETDVSISSIRNLSICCNIPHIASFNLALDNEELYIKCVLSTQDLCNILPTHTLFYEYANSLLSKQITILAYFKKAEHAAMPVVHYQVSGLDKYNDWRPDAGVLKGLMMSELKTKGHLDQEYVNHEDVPKLIRLITVACEDPAFMQHYGICPYAVGLLLQSILEKKIPKGGGSTITQQLIKNTFFSEETSIVRKFKEAITSFVAESIFCLSKRDILELYLNMAEFGIGIFGIKSAARHYFGKSIGELSPIEVLVLTYILPRPRFFEDALIMKSEQLRDKLKQHILTNLSGLKRRHVIDTLPQLPLKGVSFAEPLPFLQFDVPARIETVSYIVIHCSATKPEQITGIDELREVHLYRNFDDIGYHWVINTDGTIEEGRSEEYQGAHCQGYNDKSIGICYIGGLDDYGVPSNTMTSKQEKALVSLCAQIKSRHPGIQIIGHNQVSNKACPCFDVKEWVSKHNL